MKYIIIVIIVLLGGLLFINKDKFSSMSTDGNEAAAVKSAIGSGSGEIYYTLKSSSADSKMGSVSPSGTKKYRAGTNVTVTATANKGYYFKSWSGCPSTLNANCQLTMNSNKTVKASFTSARVQRPQCTKAQKESAEEAIERTLRNPDLSRDQKESRVEAIRESWLYCGWKI